MDPEPTEIRSTAYRYSSYDTPFWARPNSQPGRRHAVGNGATQYLALSADGAWSELIRNEELTTEEEVAMVSIPMWAIAVELSRVADYSSFAKAQATGFPPDALVDDDQSRARNEGARLRAAGFNGVLAPSAALPGALNLTIFGARTTSTWGQEPLLASSMAATMIARGGPPQGLLPRVRHYGQAHADYEAFAMNARP
jgi:hypothetical protein